MAGGAFERVARGGYLAPANREELAMAKAAKSMKGDSSEAQAQSLLDALEKTAGNFGSAAQLKAKPAANRILGADPQVQAAIVMRVLHDLGALREKIEGDDPPDLFNVHHVDGYSYAGVDIIPALLTPKLPLTDAQVVEALREVARYEHIAIETMPFLPALFKYLDARVSRQGFPAGARPQAKKIARALLTMEGAAESRLSERFAALAKA
jgi:hypothetical protein